MTEPIIINGVDVSTCTFLFDKKLCSGCNLKAVDWHCSDIKDCYYKQLQRKEKEFKELKNKLEKVENNCIKVFNLFSELGEKYTKLKVECERYKKCINDIKKELDILFAFARNKNNVKIKNAILKIINKVQQ